MKVEIVFQTPMRRWQAALAEALAVDGHELRLGSSTERARSRVTMPVLRLQQRLFGPKSSLFDVVETPRAAGFAGPADLVIRLDAPSATTGRAIEPLFNGGAGDDALLASLAGGASPLVKVVTHGPNGMIDLAQGLFAVEDRAILCRAVDQVLARTITLLRQAVRRLDRGEAAPTPAPSVPIVARGAPVSHVMRGLARKVAARLPGGRLSPNHWRIAYRRLGTGGVADLRAWPAEAYRRLPDRAGRFLADPMLFAENGRHVLFFEDYDYAADRGTIAAVDLWPDGTASEPRLVLDGPCHLSYPFVFRHGEAIYMMPEMSAARRVQLFRADPFPDRWVPDKVLIEDVALADATPVFHEGRWWLFATSTDDGGSSWDQLVLYHASDLFGPWTAHRDNPVLIDAGAARPAGPMWHEGGRFMRVVQDCREGYGRGLAICAVERLDPDRFAQTVVARLGPPARTGADGVHTLSRSDAFEVIDLRFGRFRFPRGRGRG